MAACRRSRPTASLLLMSLLLSSPIVLVSGGLPAKEACLKSPDPAFCAKFLASIPDSKSAPDARGLAELAIRAAAKAGAEMGSSARAKLDAVTVKGPEWLCMDACVADVEEAVSRLDVDKGKKSSKSKAMGDAKFEDARDYVETAESDGLTFNCDLCRGGLPAPVQTGLLPKDNEFQKIMGVLGALLKLVPGGGDGPSPAPAPGPEPELGPSSGPAPAPAPSSESD
ncbi:uncharacterized protein LOC100829432 [Brachypodium distachyon]|uniref:uncharacterized protein LOC100829432 n=1 Tax=Brachypodium distachyon TaxID=15368 RepID=UPI0001C74E7E|nr:uncharacterized protein LOC100829432 [Brachypodium distachyon]|eukprot:XP_003559214.1 uncharacterized protein LOC100829432 [Brachypodium distachyon]